MIKVSNFFAKIAIPICLFCHILLSFLACNADTFAPKSFAALAEDAQLVMHVGSDMPVMQCLDTLRFLPSNVFAKMQSDLVLFSENLGGVKNGPMSISFFIDSSAAALVAVDGFDKTAFSSKKTDIKDDQKEAFQGNTIWRFDRGGASLFVSEKDDILVASKDKWQIEGALVRMEEGGPYFNSHKQKMASSKPNPDALFSVYFDPNALWSKTSQLISNSFEANSFLLSQIKKGTDQGRLDWTGKGPYLQMRLGPVSSLLGSVVQRDESHFLGKIPASSVGFEVLDAKKKLNRYLSTYLSANAFVEVYNRRQRAATFSIFLLKENAEITEYLENKNDFKLEPPHQGFDIWKDKRSHGRHFYTLHGRYLIRAQTYLDLHSYLDQIIVGKVLDKDAEFLTALQKSEGPLQEGLYLKGGALRSLNPDGEVAEGWYVWKFEKSDAISQSGSIFFSPIAKKEAQDVSIAWKMDLGADAASAVRTVNKSVFKTVESSFFVQNAQGVLIVFDKSGKRKWETSMPQLLQSEVYAVNYLGAGKPFFLFSTFNQVWLLDESGAIVEGFPLSLNSPISSPLLVSTFGKNTDYVFFLGCQDGQLLGFDKKGIPLEGWNPGPKMGEVVWPMQHIRLFKKEHIIVQSAAGVLGNFDRNGHANFEPITMAGTPISPAIISRKKNDFSISTLSADGTFMNYGKDGTVMCDAASDFIQSTDMLSVPVHLVQSCYDFNMLFLNKNQLDVKGLDCSRELQQSGSLMLPIEADTAFVRPISEYIYIVGALDRKRNWFYAVDNLGDPIFTYKLKGETPFQLVFGENEILEVVLTTVGSEVWAYQVQ